MVPHGRAGARRGRDESGREPTRAVPCSDLGQANDHEDSDAHRAPLRPASDVRAANGARPGDRRDLLGACRSGGLGRAAAGLAGPSASPTEHHQPGRRAPSPTTTATSVSDRGGGRRGTRPAAPAAARRTAATSDVEAGAGEVARAGRLVGVATVLVDHDPVGAGPHQRARPRRRSAPTTAYDAARSAIAGARARAGRRGRVRPARHWLRHPGPSSCLRSANSAGRGRHPQPVVEPHHRGGRRGSAARAAPRSRRGGWPSTSLSWSTTGGVHRVDGRLITTGPVGPSERSGTVTSWPCSSGWSLLPREPALDGDDRVLGEVGAGQLVGAGEQQHVDGAVEVLERDHRPGVAALGDLALHRGDQAGDGDRASRPGRSSSSISWPMVQSVPLASTCSRPSSGWSET